jgi:hypothetical protein
MGNKIIKKVKCPHCFANISIFKVRDEFACPECKSILKCHNWGRLNLVLFILSSIIIFLIGIFPFGTLSYLLCNIIIFIVIMRIMSEKVECSVLREGSRKS